MNSPISRQLLTKLSPGELKALVRSASQVLSEKEGQSFSDQTTNDEEYPAEEADNLFALIKQKKLEVGEIAKAWGVHWQVWGRIRFKVKKLSVERIERLANAMNVSPTTLFELTLDCYPYEQGQYNYEHYRPQAQQDLSDITIVK